MKEEKKADNMLRALFGYFGEYPDKLPDFYRKLAETWPMHVVLCDYLSSMSDRYAVYVFENIFVPKSWTLQN